MSIVLTGTSGTDPTSSPTATCPSDGDTGGAASVNTPLQTLLNAVSWIRANLDPLSAIHAALTAPHSATAAATADRLVLRDASGRAAFADPEAAGDAATMGWTVSSPTITDGTGWTKSYAKARKIGGGAAILQLKTTADDVGGSAAWSSVATLPAGCRPITETGENVQCLGLVLDSSTGLTHACRVEIDSSGVVLVGLYDNGTSFVSMFTIGAGDVVFINTSFIVD